MIRKLRSLFTWVLTSTGGARSSELLAERELMRIEYRLLLLACGVWSKRGDEIVDAYVSKFGRLSYPTMFSVMRGLEDKGFVERSKQDYKGRDVFCFRTTLEGYRSLRVFMSTNR